MEFIFSNHLKTNIQTNVDNTLHGVAQAIARHFRVPHFKFRPQQQVSTVHIKTQGIDMIFFVKRRGKVYPASADFNRTKEPSRSHQVLVWLLLLTA